MESGDRFVRVLGQRDVIALAFGATIGFGRVPLVGTWLTEAGRGPLIGFIAVVLSAGLAIQYLPGMPSGLGVPEWVVIGVWTAAGVVFALRMDVPEYNPEL